MTSIKRIARGGGWLVGAVALVCAAGCRSPLGVPMVERLDPNDQRAVEEMWDNMLDPPDRLDRELLLETLLAYQMHSRGVDRLHFQSEKETAAGRVVMDVDYDRLDPDGDAFTFWLVDPSGAVLRQETYTFDEVEQRLDCLLMSSADPNDPNAASPCPDAFADEAALEARVEVIRAATQPARMRKALRR